MGRPGSGKETQARLLGSKTGFGVFSTGEKFRELREHRDALGQRVKEAYDTGKLLPVWFATYLFENALFKLSPETGIIFEGTGRALEEAQLFHEVVQWLGRDYIVINLDISEEEAMKRQLSRAKSGNRPESDSAEKVKVRFDEYRNQTALALTFFEGKEKVIRIEGERSIEEIHADVCSRLGIA